MSDYFSEGVLLEIFLRLPSKSVLEMRYVCKSWYSIVADPKFISRYNQFAVNNNNNDKLFVRRYDRSCVLDKITLHQNDNGLFVPCHEMNLPLDARRCPYRVIGSCHGLMCFDGFVYSKLPRHVIIWNTSLGFSKKVMVRPVSGMVEEPIFGFGFDPKSNDFKLVKIVFYTQCRYRKTGIRDVHTVEACNLSVQKWRNITSKKKAKPPCYMKENSWKVFLNNGIHWIGNCQRWGTPRHRRLALAVFDMSDEVFKRMEMPDEVINEQTVTLEMKEKLRIAVVNGLLGLFHYFIQWDKSPSFDGCCIWVMNEYGVEESWTKLYRVDLRLGIGKLVGVRKNGEIVLVTRHNCELVSFNTVTRKINRLGLYSEYIKSFYMDTYIESLAMYKSSANVVSNSMNASSSSTANATAARVKLPADEKGRAATKARLRKKGKHK